MGEEETKKVSDPVWRKSRRSLHTILHCRKSAFLSVCVYDIHQ